MVEHSDLLFLTERIEIAIQMGESHYREFKSAYEGIPDSTIPRSTKDICADVARELVAFANADGGELLIGIEDEIEVTGVPHNAEQISLILQSANNSIMKDTPLPIRHKTVVEYEDKKILYFSVDKGSKHIHQTSNGACYIRKDRDSIPASFKFINYSRNEIESQQYDKEFDDTARITHLDRELCAKVASACTGDKHMSIERFLQFMNLVEFDGDNLRLRRATLLLFARDISKWHPRSQVRILQVKGTEEQPAPNYNVSEVQTISGNIFELMSSAWESLRPAISETRYTSDGLFRTESLYPEQSCREALYNALSHRDYSIEGRGIEVRIFDDRLEILSPGRLLSKLKVEELQELDGLHETRNAYIARVLHEYGYIRELGEGMRRIHEAMKAQNLPKPLIKLPNRSFVLVLCNNADV